MKLCGYDDYRDDIRITFGMIVFNGEPFVKYNLSSIYSIAHQIIVVEGACKSSISIAGTDGHSTDGTLELLYRFKKEQDPENKIIIVTAAEEGYIDGIWPEKDEMSRAYAKRATGNYLWQVDSDEFYHEEQLARLMIILCTERPDMVSFPMLTFWGSPDYTVEGFLRIRTKQEIPRLFAWGPGFTYATHRPGTVLNKQGTDLRKKIWLRGSVLRNMKIYMYHYSLLFPHQVFNKVRYYKQLLNSPYDTWEESVYKRLEKPFRVHNDYHNISWLRYFTGEHPLAINEMIKDIQNQTIEVEQRDCTDVKNLLAKRQYRITTALLRLCARIMTVQPLYFFCRAYDSVSFRVNRLLRVTLNQVFKNSRIG